MPTFVPRAAAAAPRVRAVLAAAEPRGVSGLVLTTPGSVAWATGGANPPIDRSASTDVVWVAVGPRGVSVITTEVEAPRLRAEGPFAELGWPVTAVPWYDADAFVRRAEQELGAPAAALAADGHPAFGADLSRELSVARMALTAPDVEAIRALGRDAAAVVEDALVRWKPGEADRAVAARIAAGAESLGALAPVVLVGGDDRLARFRHPVATGAAIDDVAMAVLVASRGGLHVALTRYAGRRSAASDLEPALDEVRDIHARVLKACAPGAKTGAVLDELAAATRITGKPTRGSSTTRAVRSATRSASSRSRRPSATTRGGSTCCSRTPRSPGIRACPAAPKTRTPTCSATTGSNC